MTTNTSPKPQSTQRSGVVRRGLAGLVAAAAIAFGGTSLVNAADASAAGVHATNYAVQTATVQVESSTIRKA